MNLLAFGLGKATYGLFDQGVANFLGLETLRHGTNPLNNLSIRLTGGDPEKGGKETGSTSNWCKDNTKNYFYLFKDSEYTINLNLPTNFLVEIVLTIIGSRFLAHTHTFYSSYNLFSNLIPITSDSSKISKFAKGCLGMLGGVVGTVISPTLRFRFAQLDKRFLEDPVYRGAAYRTAQKVEWWRIGMLGSLVTGVNSGWQTRIRAKPIKFLTGVVQLTCAVALIAFCVHTIATNPILLAGIAVGAVLA